MEYLSIESQIKNFNSEPFPTVKLEGQHYAESYSLILLSKGSEENRRVVSLLSNWRKMHEKWFPSTFEVTDERTKAWLHDQVINATRLLFLISVKDQYIGHVGLFRFNEHKAECEIDNIVRGVPTYPGIMQASIRTMCEWGVDTLGIQTYSLSTSSDNIRALKLYRSLGFEITHCEPHVAIDDNGFTKWVPRSEYSTLPIGRYHLIMKCRYEN